MAFQEDIFNINTLMCTFFYDETHPFAKMDTQEVAHRVRLAYLILKEMGLNWLHLHRYCYWVYRNFKKKDKTTNQWIEVQKVQMEFSYTFYDALAATDPNDPIRNYETYNEKIIISTDQHIEYFKWFFNREVKKGQIVYGFGAISKKHLADNEEFVPSLKRLDKPNKDKTDYNLLWEKVIGFWYLCENETYIHYGKEKEKYSIKAAIAKEKGVLWESRKRDAIDWLAAKASREIEGNQNEYLFSQEVRAAARARKIVFKKIMYPIRCELTDEESEVNTYSDAIINEVSEPKQLTANKSIKRIDYNTFNDKEIVEFREGVEFAEVKVQGIDNDQQ
jgi:hypothetical protein